MSYLPKGKFSLWWHIVLILKKFGRNSIPFATTRFVCFGPFKVKFMRKLLKRWRCLFTCLTKRAVYVEVLPGLEADAYLAVVTGFSTERGNRNTKSSDVRIGFVSAVRGMLEWIETWTQTLRSLSLKSNAKRNSTPAVHRTTEMFGNERLEAARMMWLISQIWSMRLRK